MGKLKQVEAEIGGNGRSGRFPELTEVEWQELCLTKHAAWLERQLDLYADDTGAVESFSAQLDATRKELKSLRGEMEGF